MRLGPSWAASPRQNTNRKESDVNAPQMARMAYTAPGAPNRTHRSTEYDLFARVTRRLRDGVECAETSRIPLIKALHDNLQLWTTLAVDVADDGNRLPRELRARLFYLAEFTRTHTWRVLAKEAPAGVLVDINTAVMRGLAAKDNPG